MIRPSSSRILSTTVLSTLALLQAAGSPLDFRGRGFIGFNSFTNFAEVRSSSPAQVVLTSPVLASHISFNEVIISWNAELPKDTYLIVEARAIYWEKPTKYYALGHWSPNPTRHPRQSIAGQGD